LEKVINNINSCLREIEVTATEEEVKPVYDKIFKDYSTKMNIPGFRKGKVPPAMILKFYGKNIDEDFREEVINEFTKQVAKEENIRPISQAKVVKDEYKKGESFYFKVEFEVYPEIELKQYKDIEVEKPVFQVTDEDVESSLQRLIESNKELIEEDKAIDDNYIVTVDIQGTDTAGFPIIGQKNPDVPVTLNDKSLDEEIRKKLLNCSVGDEIRVNLEKQENPPKDPFNASFKVKKVQKIIYPEVDESFIKKVTRDKLSTIDDLRNQIRSNLENEYQNLSEDLFVGNIDSELIKRNDFDVPDTMIENYLDSLIESVKEQQPNKMLPRDFDEHDYRQKNRTYAIRKIKLYILNSKIAEAENIKVDDVDLSIHAESESLRTGIAKERLMNYYKTSDEIKDKLLQKKLYDFLKDKNIVTEKLQSGKHEESKIITE
jgi:trigger factor